jgi:hypothetical protein
MATGDQYRVKAADMYGKVKDYSDPSMRAHFENLALSYLRLAEQADRRDTYEHPAETHPAHRPSNNSSRKELVVREQTTSI